MTLPHDDTALVERFHRHYYDLAAEGGTWKATYWLGTPTQKLPLDLWMYQQIITDVRPDVIIETGTLYGGSALFLASVCDLLGSGRVITIDINATAIPIQHPRLTMMTGSSTSEGTHTQLDGAIAPDDTCMVILDSDHSCDHVLDELRLYAPRVSPGHYLVVEDTNVNGHPVLPDFGPGPAEAVAQWLPGEPDFAVDRGRESFGLTFNPGGFLRRSGDARIRTAASSAALKRQVASRSGDWLDEVADEMRRLRLGAAALESNQDERDQLLLRVRDLEARQADGEVQHHDDRKQIEQLERALAVQARHARESQQARVERDDALLRLLEAEQQLAAQRAAIDTSGTPNP